MDGLVSTEWLAGAPPHVLVLDASYTSTIPGAAPSDPRGDFDAGHIPGARYLDLDTLVDARNPLPSMLPPQEEFLARMRALGVTPETQIVLYDAGVHHTACRAWWVLRMFGVEAAILDGGIRKWKAEERPLSDATESVAPSALQAGPARAQVRTLDEMRATAEQIADARSAARFTGDEADPRADCAAGHMPGARNVPYSKFFNADGTWKDADTIRAVFAAASIDPARPLVATCGSGITAAIIVFAAHLLGHEAALYDGSWSEWGAQADTPKALGPA